MSLRDFNDNNSLENAMFHEKSTTENSDLVRTIMALGEDVQHDKILDVRSKRFPTDADVLNAVGSCKNDFLNKSISSESTLLRACSKLGSSETRTVDKPWCSTIPVQHWSDEDDRYPPQMSLSPTPEELRRKRFIKEKIREKRNMATVKAIENTESKRRDENTTKPANLAQRRQVARIAPIVTRQEYNADRIVSTDITSLLRTQQHSTTTPTTTKVVYEREPGTQSDSFMISSPSLVRPILTKTTPVLNRKETCHQNSSPTLKLFASKKYKRNKQDLSPKSIMPHRLISRSKSSNMAATASAALFPEITCVSPVQRTSRSISDFRQSSSIFGRNARRNPSTESFEEQNESLQHYEEPTNVSKRNEKKQGCTKVGESTKTKLRRILSLH